MNVKPLVWVIVVALALSGVWMNWGDTITVYAQPALDYVGVGYASKPAMAVVIRDASKDATTFTKEQIAWMSDPKFSTDCKATGIEYHRIDQGIQDRSGKTPDVFVAPLARVKDKLPRLVLVGSRGGLTDYAVPADDAAARKLLGIN